MKVAVKFYQRKFQSDTSKDAYLEACKWVAMNIISKVEIGETFWRIDKDESADIPTFKLELYAMLEESDHTDSFCDRCQEFHRAFFINENYNCDRCNMKSYRANMEHKLKVKKEFRKERLKYIIKNE